MCILSYLYIPYVSYIRTVSVRFSNELPNMTGTKNADNKAYPLSCQNKGQAFQIFI